MAFLWDYSKDKVKNSDQGKLLLLERAVNFGPEKGEKISLKQVEKYWEKLNLFPKKKRLMELLIWGE